jgi:hypothetical protein
VVPITYKSFSSTDLQLLPAVASMKCLFCVLVPAEKHGDFLQLVHQREYGSLLSCGLWPSILLFVTHFQEYLFRLSIMNMRSPVSNGIYLYTTHLSIDNCQLD